jgi:hypothetical protein
MDTTKIEVDKSAGCYVQEPYTRPGAELLADEAVSTAPLAGANYTSARVNMLGLVFLVV